MKFVGTLFQGKPASLEEGPLKYRSANEYIVLHREESTTNCGRFVQIVKLILWIELIILVGWLGCLSFSHYNNDCGVSAIGCKASEVDYDHIEVENSRGRRGVPNTEDEREKCDINANATRKRLASFAAHFVNGESSDPTVVGLRSKFIYSAIFAVVPVIVKQAWMEAFSLHNNGTTNGSLLWMTPDDAWQPLMEWQNERFLNSTNPENRHRLTASGSPTAEMASVYRNVTESLYIDLRDCNGLLLNSLLSVHIFNTSNENAQRRKRESEPVMQLSIDCRDAEEQLLKERRERHDAIAAEIASDHQPIISTMILLSSIDSALSAKRPSEVTVEDHLLQDDSGLIPWKRFMSDAPLELKKEFYRLVRDEFLELRNETNEPSAWEGYDLTKAYRNWTDGLSMLTQSDSPEAVLNITIKFGKAFDLHYVETEREDRSIDSESPVFGKLTYVGAEPEKLGVRRLRHILNGFVRLYFRVINRLGPCEPATDETPTRDRRFVEKRSVIPDPGTESNTATCWNGEQDLDLIEERRARLAAVAIEKATGKVDVYDWDLLTAIETALNASSTSEIHFDEKFTRPRMLMDAIIHLTSNASLELHKEIYAITRDIVLQLRSLAIPSSPEWKGYDVAGISQNVSASIDLPIDPTAKSTFENFVRIGEAFKLRYVELQSRDIGADSDKPVFGKFTYIGEEPEGMGMRHMRHILDAFVKAYFKIQDPSGMCHSSAEPHVAAGRDSTPARNKRTVTSVPKPDRKHPKSSTTTCWNQEEDRVLLEERRARLETFTTRSGLGNEYEHHTQFLFLEGIEKALNATSTSEIRFGDALMKETMVLPSIHYLVANASLELHKEGYELARDLFLEMHAFNHRGPEWEGWSQDDIGRNLTDAIFFSSTNMTLQSIFDNFVRFGQAFNLRHEKPEKLISGNVPYGKFTYLGEEPEKLGLRHLRHTLDGFIRLFYKIQNPSTPMVCDSTTQLSVEESQGETPTRDRHAIEKRSVTADSNPESVNTKCWSEEDKVLQEERLERLENSAVRHLIKDAYSLRTNSFLESIEAALNATSTSEIHFEDADHRESMHVFIESLAENSSLELRKEGYEISRDIYLELYELLNHNPEWDGYDIDSITQNLTASNFLSVNVTEEVTFNDLVTFSKAFNLRYEELGNRKSEDEADKPVFGKFTYVGEEPEKLGVRHLRHILDAIAKLYFKTQDPSSICNLMEQPPTGDGKNEKPTADSIPDPTKTNCWSAEQDPVLLEERRSRLESFAIWKERNDVYNMYTSKYLDVIETALNATSTSEIHIDDSLSGTMPILSFIQDHASNSSLDLYKEGLEITRDLYLEMDKLKDHHSEWKGFDLNSILNNLTDSGMSRGYNGSPEIMFNELKKFGRAFNLHYEELEKNDRAAEPDKPVFGKFIYLGEDPEQLGIRHIRHIFDGFVRFYFKVQNPSALGQCNSAVQAPVKPSVEKRSITVDPVPESETTKCWNEEEDKILEDERLERLGAFAFRTSMNERDIAHMKTFLESIDAALNATSISEIRFDSDVQRSPLIKYMEYLSENSSLDIRKEAYEITRDLYLELFKFRMHSPEWDGYTLERIVDNITGSPLFADNATQEAIFNDIVTCMRVFNLRYEELGTRESGAEPNKPVFGKFTYVGEEPEKVGVRHLRQILDAFTKFYFKTQEPSLVCKGETPTTTPASDAINGKCWNVEYEPAFLEQRQERLHAFEIWNDRYQAEHLYRRNFMDGIGEALTAANASEIHFDQKLLTSTPIISVMQNFTNNSSLEIYKEGLELTRDLFLEIVEMKDRTTEWEDYDVYTILNNLTDSMKSDSHKTTPEIMFSNIANLARAFNLRYEELGKRNTADEPYKPVFGKFIYLGEDPEKLGIRHIRHILDGFVRFYFKVQNPSTSGGCNSAVQTPAKRSVEKRSVTADPVPKSTTTKCWSEEEDKILEEERLERWGSFALRVERNEKDNSYTKTFMKGIEAALNATSISEIHFDDDTRRSPLLKYMEFLGENSSLEIRKEAYEINRDLHLELFKFKMHSPEWKDYDLNDIADNITASHIFAVNLTQEAMFNDIVTFSNAFNLRYEELDTRESGTEPNKPVFGKFTYVGEEPEKLGVRHLRHILDAFVKYYFKTQEPSSVCNGETSTATAASEGTTAKCWNVEDDPALLQERRERLEAYAIWNEKYQARHLYMQKYLDAIGEALNATSASDIQFDESLLGSTPILPFIEFLAMNSSLELYKEGLEIARDLYLEIEELTDRTAGWEGYDFDAIQNNLTDSRNADGYKPTTQITFEDITNFGRAFDLRYNEVDNGDSADKTDKPVVGKFTFLGEGPEKLGVRHIRHLLDGFVRFYFKVRNPSIACISSAEGGENTNTGQAL